MMNVYEAVSKDLDVALKEVDTYFKNNIGCTSNRNDKIWFEKFDDDSLAKDNELQVGGYYHVKTTFDMTDYIVKNQFN